MKKELKAVYENGVFKPLTNPQLKEGEEVTLVIETPVPHSLDILQLAGSVYEGLTAEEVEEVEKIALDRSHFWGGRE